MLVLQTKVGDGLRIGSCDIFLNLQSMNKKKITLEFYRKNTKEYFSWFEVVKDEVITLTKWEVPELADKAHVSFSIQKKSEQNLRWAIDAPKHVQIVRIDWQRNVLTKTA